MWTDGYGRRVTALSILGGAAAGFLRGGLCGLVLAIVAAYFWSDIAAFTVQVGLN